MKGSYIDPKKGEEVFRFEMAPIRVHKELIQQVAIFGNLVISLDTTGLICLSFISYEDAEEYKTNTIEDFEGSKVV